MLSHAELFEEGRKSKNLPLVRTELRKFKDLYESSTDLRSLFLNPVMTLEQRNAALTEVFKQNGIKSNEAQVRASSTGTRRRAKRPDTGDAMRRIMLAALNARCLRPQLSHEHRAHLFLRCAFFLRPLTVQSFIKGAAATKNLGRIKQIVSDFDKLVTYELKEVHASVTSAEPLQPAQLQRLESALKKKISPDEKLLLQTKVEPSILGGVIVLLDQQMLDLSVSGQIRKIDAAIRT